MASVSETVHIAAAPDAVWDTIRDFGAIDEYVPPITSAEQSGEGIGATRTLTLADGGQVIERLEALNDDARSLRYTIVESPLPIENYDGPLSVSALNESGCEVEWASTFDVIGAPEAELIATFRELYASGLAGLKEKHAGQAQ